MELHRILILLSIMSGLASQLYSQAPTLRNASVLLPNCPYRQCELTYVPGRFGGRLEVGVGVQSVISGGFSGGGIVDAVSAVPEAERIARRGRALQTTANTIRLASVMGTAALLLAARRTNEPGIARLLAITLGGTSFLIAPMVPQDMAHDRFAEAADAYNRELAR
jgi:hypothetical protein